jgi:hypothetical protein
VDFKRVDNIKDLTAADPNINFQRTRPMLDMVWADQSLLFVSESADTPTSLMPSFDTLDTPKDDITMNHGLPFHDTPLTANTTAGMMPQHPQSLSYSNIELWPPLQYNVDASRCLRTSVIGTDKYPENSSLKAQAKDQWANYWVLNRTSSLVGTDRPQS